MRLFFLVLFLNFWGQLSAADSLDRTFCRSISDRFYPQAAKSHSVRLDLDDFFESHTRLNRSERASIACEIKNTLESRYVLLPLKKQRLNINLSRLWDDCARDELNHADDDLAFDDRMRKCIALAQDTHLQLGFQTPTPAVYNGLILKDVDGRFVISSRFSKVLEYYERRANTPNLLQTLQIGAEVVEIDGLTPAEWVEKLKPYIASSSEFGRHKRAVIAIFTRNFLLPDQSGARLVVRENLPNGKYRDVRVVLPWYLTETPRRISVRRHFERSGIRSFEDLKWYYDEESQSWKAANFMERDGFTYYAPLVPISLNEYFSGERVVLRTGEYIHRIDQAFCYAQLFSFASPEVRLKGGMSEPLIDVFRRFLSECEVKQLPLVFDLRANGGGLGYLPGRLIGFTLGHNESTVQGVGAFRNSRFGISLLSYLLNYSPSEPEVGYFTGPSSPNQLLEMLKFTSKESPYLALLVSGPETQSHEVTHVFSQNVYALVTPFCVSACDSMSALIAGHPRGHIIGSQSDGAGAGYFMGFPPVWHDEYDRYSLRIPSRAFGFTEGSVDEQYLSYEGHESYLIENRGIQADTKYITQSVDLLKNHSGWLETTLEVVFSKKNKETESPALLPPSGL